MAAVSSDFCDVCSLCGIVPKLRGFSRNLSYSLFYCCV